MPTYAYACTACGHRFEVQQSFSDASLSQCPECEGKLRKLFNTVGIVFKGSGFYRTDSRASAKGATSSSDGSSGSESSPKPAETAAAGSSSSSSAGSSSSSSSPTGSSGSAAGSKSSAPAA